MRESQTSIAAWADETFGPAVSLESIAVRAQKELTELVEKCATADKAIATNSWIGDEKRHMAAEEAADVVIVLARIFESCGIDMHATIDRKMAINRARRWVLDGNGHGQHVEEP